MKEFLWFTLVVFLPFFTNAQETIATIDEIELDKIQPNQVKKYWLKMIDNGMSQPVCIPVIIAKGKTTYPVLGLLAGIHGNELNGIRVINKVIETLNLDSLQGTIIAIPGLNAISLLNHQRRYVDEEDLNRNFPGKEKGNRSQQYVWQINQKILTKLDYLVDMHTASFGRANSFYVRGALNDTTIKKMTMLQNADIILANKGVPSFGKKSAATRTMRAEAMSKGIPSITVEYGNPQVFQPKMIERGTEGIQNLLSWLKMQPKKIIAKNESVICKKSYWIYIKEGGYLEIHAELTQLLKKGELIATLRNPFGEIIKEYFCSESGIVIGKSTNPINMSGGRILHLGILK